ncbi:branched-chain amino acid ABC transporter permease [Rhodoferax sp.]|uniref:branched-chain amino acid ABC transporter permease n=1 Tax=Rhodoferax sp. TaxID=50421 RepID=UPI00374DB3F1
MNTLKYSLLAGGAFLCALALPSMVDASHLNTLILVLMAAQLGVAWNMVGGYAGQVSLGHAAFYGLGAYTSTLLLLKFGINPWLGVLAGGLVAALLSLAFGWSCFRLKGHYFAMATIAVAELVQIFFTEWEFGGGAVGLYVPMDKQGWLWLNFATKLPYYWLALGLLLLTLAANWWIERSYLGYYFRAIKDEPDAARSIGINIARYKQIALSVSAFFTATGGSLYAQKELYVDPNSVLSTALSIKMALVAILGGVGTLLGPVVGSVILTSIEEFSRIFFGGTGRGTDVIIYASLIIIVAVFYPTGIIGGWRSFQERRAARGDASRQMAAHAAHAAQQTAKEAV